MTKGWKHSQIRPATSLRSSTRRRPAGRREAPACACWDDGTLVEAVVLRPIYPRTASGSASKQVRGAVATLGAALRLEGPYHLLRVVGAIRAPLGT
jgi:hypothetical protein